MRVEQKHGKLLTVRNGYLVCPVCRRNLKLMPVLPNTSGVNIVAYCSKCKSRTIVDIDKGLCFESLCQ